MDSATIRQLSTAGTLSGALVGGALFGAGMVLARGCASRLLVLASTGNLRALVTGLVLTVVAQASLRGILSPVRQELSSLWVIEADARNLMAVLPEHTGVIAGAILFVGAVILGVRSRLTWPTLLTAGGVGAAVAAGWWFSATLSAQAFDIVPVQSVTFTGPSADTLMSLINQPKPELGFGFGLVPGVAIGAFLAAVLGETSRSRPLTRRRRCRAILSAHASWASAACSQADAQSAPVSPAAPSLP